MNSDDIFGYKLLSALPFCVLVDVLCEKDNRGRNRKRRRQHAGASPVAHTEPYREPYLYIRL